MSKLIMLRGLPASGKSTKAKELSEMSGNCIRLNKDLLREMLHFNKFTGRNEGLTRDAERVLAKYFLIEKKLNVIVDDTNLTDSHNQSWSQLATECNAKFESAVLDTSLEECLNRNTNRDKSVPTHVIVQMAMSCQMFPTPAKPIVICDIDGTVADINHRLHFIKPSATVAVSKEAEAAAIDVFRGQFKKDWKSFFDEVKNDTPRHEIIKQLQEYAKAGHLIVFVSGRPEHCRYATMKWLADNVFCDDIMKNFVTLIMRRDTDKRDDDLVKKDIYDKYLKQFQIEVVFDDRPRIIEMWRKQGLRVIDVGKGIDF